MKELQGMHHQQAGFCFGFIEIIPGIVAPVIMQKNPSVQAAHEYFKKYNGQGMINGKWKDFLPYDQMQQYSSGKQVKEKQKGGHHGNFT
jgi:hypothetical protein